MGTSETSTTDGNGASAAARREQRELGSVGNALRLIELLATLPHAGVSDLARALRLSKPAVDRLLITLMSAGFAEQNPDTKKYRLSAKLMTIADGIRSRMTILEVARPHLAGLAERTRETVNLGVFSGDTVVYIDKIQSDDLFRIEVRPGTSMPAYSTALGKAMLAFTPDARVQAYLRDLVPVSYTPHTIVTKHALIEQLDEVRERGYAVDEGEMLIDVSCVAAPILDTDGRAIAAVSVTAPRSRFDDKRAELTTLVPETARRISESAAVSDVHVA